MKTLDGILAEKMHNWYEQQAKVVGWNTQEKTKVPFKDLPEENKKVMLYVAQQINKWALEKCLGVIGVRDYPVTDEVDKYLNGLLKQQRERARKEFSNE